MIQSCPWYKVKYAPKPGMTTSEVRASGEAGPVVYKELLSNEMINYVCNIVASGCNFNFVVRRDAFLNKHVLTIIQNGMSKFSSIQKLSIS